MTHRITEYLKQPAASYPRIIEVFFVTASIAVSASPPLRPLMPVSLPLWVSSFVRFTVVCIFVILTFIVDFVFIVKNVPVVAKCTLSIIALCAVTFVERQPSLVTTFLWGEKMAENIKFKKMHICFTASLLNLTKNITTTTVKYPED